MNLLAVIPPSKEGIQEPRQGPRKSQGFAQRLEANTDRRPSFLGYLEGTNTILFRIFAGS